ncbi:hypothetical protein T492DRAFT_887503, partial [Pavlovales sp. CCMP2436]
MRRGGTAELRAQTASAEAESTWRLVAHRDLRSSELLGALAQCGFALSERELRAVAGPELLRQQRVSHADFQQLYPRLVATDDTTLARSVHSAFASFNKDGRLDRSALRRVLRDSLDRRLAALGELDVRAFVRELRASLDATAAMRLATSASTYSASSAPSSGGGGHGRVAIPGVQRAGTGKAEIEAEPAWATVL